MDKLGIKYFKDRNFLKMFVLLLLILVSIEAFLRLFLPLHPIPYLHMYQYDKDLAYKAAPGHWLHSEDYQQECYVNKLGSINFQDNFNDYRYLIFALGDSYTQGTGLPSDASYTFQLDLLLNLVHGREYIKKFGVVNLGLAPFGAEQSLIALKRYINMIGKPVFVLYLGADNDYNDDILFRLGIRHWNIVKNSPYYGMLYYPLSFLFFDLEIGKRINYFVREKMLQEIANKKGGSKKMTGGKKNKALCTAELEIGTIKEIIKVAQDNGGQAILSWAHGGESYIWLKSWSNLNGIAFADWLPSVDSVINAIPNLPARNPHSGGHYRTWVNSLIAQTYKKEIDRLFFLVEKNNNISQPSR